MTRKRLILIPFVALAAATAIVATAFACTVFRGTFTINGNGTGSVPVTATGDNNGFMLHKSITPVGVTNPTDKARAFSTGGTVTVSTDVDPADSTNKLGSGTYQVRYYNSIYTPVAKPGFTNHQTWKTDCMAVSFGVDLGLPVTVGTDGRIVGQPKTFSLPPAQTKDQAPAESAVCISDPLANEGNEAPLTIM